MHRLGTRPSWIHLALLLAVLPSLIAQVRPPKPGQIEMEDLFLLQPNGDARVHTTIRMTAGYYVKQKRIFPNPFQLLRKETSERTQWEVDRENLDCAYDDAHNSLVCDVTFLGVVHNKGNGKWVCYVGDDDARFVTMKEARGPDDRTTFFFSYDIQPIDQDLRSIRGNRQIRLPQSAVEPRWNESDRTISYFLPYKPDPDEQGLGDLSVRVAFKDRLMTCPYKVYGFPKQQPREWVAKAVLCNTGNDLVKDVRIRYKIEGYSDWSAWDKYPELRPSQTAVSLFHPQFHKLIAEISSNTPVTLHVEWRFQDNEGRLHEDSDSSRLILLGSREFIFSSLKGDDRDVLFFDDYNNAPLLAAWCSRDDAVIKEFAGEANKRAGGVGAAGKDPRETLAVLKAIYELMLASQITYQHPAALPEGESFDATTVQHVKFPRDVIRDESGTCVDLAVFYASVAHSVGLKPYLVLIPGHAFPVIENPATGLRYAVETTGVGGHRAGVAEFEQVLAAGRKEYEQALNDGRLYQIDLQDLWNNKGVSNPELPALSPDIPEKWRKTIQRQPNPHLEPQPIAPGAPPWEQYLGTWNGAVFVNDPAGTTTRASAVMQITPANPDPQAQLVVDYPGNTQVRLIEQFQANLQPDGTLTLTSLGAYYLYVQTNMQQPASPDEGVCQIQGDRLTGQFGNPAEGYWNFEFDRR